MPAAEANFNFNLENIPDLPHCGVVKLSGAIDAKTVMIFQEQLDRLQSESYKGFVLDMEGIRYVNSTGLGTLVNVSDALENKGGAMALIKIHPKVRVVFDMLGLHNFFKIFSTGDEALKYIREKVFGRGQPASSSSPTAPERTRSGATRSASPAVSTPTASAPAATPPTSNNLFPLFAICPNCKSKLNIPKPGGYRCPRCNKLFKVLENGTTVSVGASNIPPLQFRLVTTDECTEGLTAFVGAVAARIGFNREDVQNIKASIQEISSAIIEKAYDNKLTATYIMEMRISSLEVKIQFMDSGKYMDDDSFTQTRTYMQEFIHKDNGRSGNVISISKRLR